MKVDLWQLFIICYLASSGKSIRICLLRQLFLLWQHVFYIQMKFSADSCVLAAKCSQCTVFLFFLLVFTAYCTFIWKKTSVFFLYHHAHQCNTSFAGQINEKGYCIINPVGNIAATDKVVDRAITGQTFS